MSEVVCYLLLLVLINRSHPHTLTLVLQNFKNQGGLKILAEMLEELKREFVTAAESCKSKNEKHNSIKHVVMTAQNLLLTFFSHTVNPKSVTEANQASAMASRLERDKDKPDYFIPAQFLVELRHEVFSTVEKLWNDEIFMEYADQSILKPVIEILRLTLEGDAEHGAYRRSDKLPPRSKQQAKAWKLRNPELLLRLMNNGYEEHLATEALYRCNESYSVAEEYCALRRVDPRASKFPPPKEGYPSSIAEETSKPSEELSDPLVLEGSSAETMPQSSGNSITGISQNESHGPENHSGFARALSLLPGESADVFESIKSKGASQEPDNSKRKPSANGKRENDDLIAFPITTIDDLDEQRSKLRKNIIDRCLDILSSHQDATFDLSDLVSAAMSKANDPTAMREEIGETLIQSLISLQSPENLPAMGVKIAAYAHILAILLQDKEFYSASEPELKNNATALIGFIKWIPSDSQPCNSSLIWIPKILLIVERLLAEDVLPQQIQWNFPQNDDVESEVGPTANLLAPIICQSDKMLLFDNILDLLPHIEKDESLSLSIIRSLVILTRDRQLAIRLGEKKNMRKLFLMVKQLAGLSDEKLQGSFLLILRHIVEDEKTICRIMKTEIRTLFETRQQRHIETTSYIRQLYHLVLRSPEVFVEVTNEMLEIPRFDSGQRPQMLALKKIRDDDHESIAGSEADVKLESSVTKDASSIRKTEHTKFQDDKEDSKTQEMKPPTIENPDGVVHYLLCELLSYKDVTHKELPATEKKQSEDSHSKEDDAPSNHQSVLSENLSTMSVNWKHEERNFRAEQNPIFMYRCFVLFCLTELLACCNRTKLEFISFSRKADPQIKTPTKPHSRVLDYLLNSLVPVGNPDSNDDVSLKKKIATSNWAMSVIVSLCARTEEHLSKNDGNSDVQTDDLELLFVRKFVLEYTLRTFKDAVASTEPLDIKYSRLLNLCDLFNRMLVGKPTTNNSTLVSESGNNSNLAKLMIEKNLINILTTCLGEIDLNFPTSKRTVKYLLRLLKVLTKAALDMSITSDLAVSSMPSNDSRDNISTASSISDYDESREETPDLFRHSTLGIFEPPRDEETESDEEPDDEDAILYEDEYGDEMDFDDNDMQEDDDVISEEDEEIDGIGPIEGLPGDVNVQVIIQHGDNSSDENDPDDNPDDEAEDIDEESHDDNDDDDDIEIMDEAVGEDQSALSNGDEWISEENGNMDNLDNRQITHGSNVQGQRGVLDHIVRVVESEGAEGLLERLDDADMDLDIENEDMVDDEIAEDDDGKQHLILQTIFKLTLL